MKNIFARWGIPEVVVSDNGGQFTSTGFGEFTSQDRNTHFPQMKGAVKWWGKNHKETVTGTRHMPSINGMP